MLSENFIAEISPKLLMLEESLKIARENVENAQNRNRNYFDPKRRVDPGYTKGDKVLVKSHPRSIQAKQFTARFAPKRDGPYLILRKHGSASYEVSSMENPDIPIGTFHTSMLYPFREITGNEASALAPIQPIRKRGRPKKTQPLGTSDDTSAPTHPTTPARARTNPDTRQPRDEGNRKTPPRRQRGRPKKIRCN